MLLKTCFVEVSLQFHRDRGLIDRLWMDISAKYSGKSRYYHNLNHLTDMLAQLDSCRALISDWDCVIFALVYHDIVYGVTSNDNEEKSAAEARGNLVALNVSQAKISLIEEHILATKTHETATNNDINLFTDADLAILGTSDERYKIYSQQVRKEYSIYPDILYNRGRRKVLEHFLEMPAIFKTDFFRDKLEVAARRNLENELKTL